MRPHEPHQFEEEASVNLIPGLGPIHLPSNEICRQCGHGKGHLLHQPTWALVDQLADALAAIERIPYSLNDRERCDIARIARRGLVAAGRIEG